MIITKKKERDHFIYDSRDFAELVMSLDGLFRHCVGDEIFKLNIKDGMHIFRKGEDCVLVYLLKHGKSHFGAVMEAEGLPAGTLSNVMKSFKELGLAEMEQSSIDRRYRYLELTEKGKELAELAFRARSYATSVMLCSMSGEEALQFKRLLSTAVRNLRQIASI